MPACRSICCTEHSSHDYFSSARLSLCVSAPNVSAVIVDVSEKVHPSLIQPLSLHDQAHNSAMFSKDVANLDTGCKSTCCMVIIHQFHLGSTATVALICTLKLSLCNLHLQQSTRTNRACHHASILHAGTVIAIHCQVAVPPAEVQLQCGPQGQSFLTPSRVPVTA